MNVTLSVTAKRTLRYGLAGALLLSCSPAALHAEVSNAQLAREIAELKAQIRALRGSVVETRKESRSTREKVRVVTERGSGYALPPPGPALPLGAVPAFVTADKKLQFGSLTITPGGFVAMESRFSTRDQQADIGSQYSALPLGGPQAGSNELRFSAHQSRVALLVEAPITPTFLASSYGEFDFLAAGSTSNSNESNSYVPRIRHLYGQLDATDVGFHLLAGQTWSLATLNSKGITPRNEVTPPSIDAQYVPGFVWKRQPQVRLTKDFDKRLWLSLSAEASQTTFSGANCPNANVNAYGAAPTPGTGVSGVFCDLFGTNNLSGTQQYSLNHVPDVVGKVAYEAQFADRDVHLEAFGLYRDLYDRVAYINGTSANRDTTGYGFGGGLIVPVIPKRLDFQASGIYGRGIGTYGTTQMADTTVAQNGSLTGIREFMALGGLTLHATPAIDLYAFGGIERVFSSYYNNGAAINFANGGGFSGFGIPNANDSGCGNVNNAVSGDMAIFSGTTCAGNTKQTYQGTVGMWDKLYKGSFGEVRVGLQYSYTRRELFNSTFVFAGANRGTFGIDDQSVFTSFRYYPFQ